MAQEPMDLIRKAAGDSATGSGKSLIEKAAERLGAVSGQENIASPVKVREVRSAAIPASSPPEMRDAPRSPRAERPATRTQVTVDFERLKAMGFVLPGEHSKLAEEMRMIKRALLRNAFSQHGQGRSHVIMVTSALESEGKTFTATNLALSMALERDKTVLLIDADLPRPQIPAMLGFKSDRGLAELLADDQVDMADVLVRTNVENLTVLPAGRDIPHANELFASARMAKFVAEVAERYSDRIIIFDSPPLLARSEPSVLATHVGQIVLVVEAERTNETALHEALKLLEGQQHVGLVLNKVQSHYGGGGFGQYYDKDYR